MARMKKEDIQESQSSSTVDDEFDFNAQMDERDNAYVHNHIPNMEIEKECSQILKGREKSFTWYSKNRSAETTLDDFEVRKVIG